MTIEIRVNFDRLYGPYAILAHPDLYRHLFRAYIYSTMEKRSDGHLFVGRMGTFLVGWAYVKKYTMKIMKYNANILKQRRLRTRHLNPMFIGTITTTVQTYLK